MASPFKNTFFKVNFDLDETKIPPDTASFLKDMTWSVNTNNSLGIGQGSNAGVMTPFEGNNTVADILLPSGDNYTIGAYSSEQTNELYFFNWNSNNNHQVWVINGDNKVTSLVYQSSLLKFTLDPQYFICEGRCTLELRSHIDPVTKKQTNYKFLIFTGNNANQFFISVDDSIATSSFSTSFFSTTSAFYNQLELVHLGVPTSLKPITIIPIDTVPTDIELQNQIIRQGWQFRVKFIDIFGRESEHGIISDQYITIVGGGCINASNGMPRCIHLTLDAGNPLVNKIQVEFRKWVGDQIGPDIATGWNIYETLDKYDNSGSLQWYERTINPALTYDAGTNTINYTFCADKNIEPIDPRETSRTENSLPLRSSGIASVNKSLALSNNVHGFQPIDPAELAKIAFNIQPPATTGCPAAPMRKITVYLNIYNPSTTHSSIIRQSFGTTVFGNEDGSCGSYGAFSGDQVFGDQANSGFIVYMAGLNGSEYVSVGSQGDLNPSTGVFNYQGIVGSLSFPNAPAQQANFIVPAGKYILRVASHKAKTSDPDFQRTSTYIAGLCQISDLANVGGGQPSYANNLLKEIEVDCTSDDVILNQPTDPCFVVLDLVAPGGSAQMDGYLVEQSDGITPVEMNPVLMTGLSGYASNTDVWGSFFTDHNGYYFFGTQDGADLAHLYINSDACDGVKEYINLTQGTGGIKHGDGSGTPAGSCSGVHGNWKNKVSLFANPKTFPDAARRHVLQQICLCDEDNAGVPGIPVIMTKGIATATDANGNVNIVAHNRYNYVDTYSAYSYYYPPTYVGSIPDFSIFPHNEDVLVFSQKAGCQFTICADCTPSTSDANISYIGCGGDRTTTLDKLLVNVDGINIFGISSGGKYSVGVWLHDVIGRHTYVQVGQGDAKFVNAPNLNDLTFRQFALTSIGFIIDPSILLPTYFTKMTFLVGSNTLFSDYFSWAADWVQFVDNTGLTSANPTQIRIYYQSLNEYNKQNNNGTNTNWQFIGTGQNNNGAPIEGDIVQFIMNGDRQWLPPGLSAPVTYDKQGAFFTIEYTNDLAGLINGVLFRVIRPIQYQQANNLYYEQSFEIDIIDGVPQLLSGTLPYFDSYMLTRQLPVPVLQGQPGPIGPGAPAPVPIIYTSTNLDTTIASDGYAGNNVNNSNGVVVVSSVDSQTNFPFLFESPSPSDFWGSHLKNVGRIGVANPYEEESRVGTEIAISASLSDRPNGFNGLSYYEAINASGTQMQVVFDRNVFGNIQVLLVEMSQCLAICDSDTFGIRYNTSQVGVNKIGDLISQSQYGIFNAPELKAGQNFGCIPKNINSIARYQGIVYWLDAKGRLVQHNFSEARDVSQSGYYGYLLARIGSMNQENLEPEIYGNNYFVGGIDPKTSEYFLTSFNIPVSGTPQYINGSDVTGLDSPETIFIDLQTGELKGMVSFTPELYKSFPGLYTQKNFLSFKQGIPYLHHLEFSPAVPFCNFYGIQVLPRVKYVVNPNPESKKRFFYTEVYVPQSQSEGSGQFRTALFYSDFILTDKGQLSRLLTPQWMLRDGYSCAPFLFDINTPVDPNLPIISGATSIRDGNPLQGSWCLVSLVVQSTYTGQYFELSACVTYTDKLLKSAE